MFSGALGNALPSIVMSNNGDVSKRRRRKRRRARRIMRLLLEKLSKQEYGAWQAAVNDFQ